MAPASEPPPPCSIFQELLDEDGRLDCPEGTSYTDELLDEECRADLRHPVLPGPDIGEGERVLPRHSETNPPTWWASDGLLVICDEGASFVSYVADLEGGCWLRCWGERDEVGRCLLCSGADTCVPCEGL